MCDANVWIALSIPGHEHHTVTNSWFEALQDDDAVLFCRATQTSFLRLLTLQAIFAPYQQAPLSDQAAWAVYDAILADDRILFREEPPKIETEWRRLTASGQASPKRWMDAYLAAFCIAGGYRLVTLDLAFQSFANLDLLVLR